MNTMPRHNTDDEQNSDLAVKAQYTKNPDEQISLAQHPSEAVRWALSTNPFLDEAARRILDAYVEN